MPFVNKRSQDEDLLCLKNLPTSDKTDGIDDHIIIIKYDNNLYMNTQKWFGHFFNSNLFL